MPKLRLDQLPLDRRKQATSGEGVVNRREVDPNVVGEVRARHGSVRQDSDASALGLIAEGYKSYITSNQTFTASGNFTALFNLKWGSIAQAGDYPILTLRAGTANTHWYQLYLNRTGDNLKFGLRAADSVVGSAQLQQTGTLTANSSAGIALKRVANRLSVFVDGSEKGYIADVSGDSPTGPFYIDLLGTVQGVHDFASKPSIGTTHPIISNFKIDATNISVSSGDDALRVAGDFDYHWKLDGTYETGFIPAETGANRLSGIPSDPQVATRDSSTDAALRFNGLSGALLVRHDTSLDWYYSSFLNSAPASSFGFHIEGTRAIEPVDKETCLIDYGGTDGLCKLVIKSDGAVKFTMNGISVTTDNAQFTSHADEYAFKIFCGRGKNADGNQTLFLRSEVPGNASYLVEEKNNAATNYTPFLDLNDIPNIYVGSESSASSLKRFKGSLTKVAMYPSYYTADAGQSLSEFSFDLTTDTMVDGSPHNRSADLIEHFVDENVNPIYAQGGLTDAKFISVEAGVVLSGSGPKNYNSKLVRQISDDVTSSRLGQLTFLESDGRVHVINKRKGDARTLGIPAPSRLVSQQALGGGVLSGAYNYSYRFVSDLGTHGPLLNLDPVKADEASRIMLGRPSDPSWSALGETYLITEKNTGQHGVTTGSAPTANTAYPMELYSRCGTDLDDVEFKETVWHRGAKSEHKAGWRSNSNAIPFATGANWTMQYSFRLGDMGGTRYGAICGMGPSGGYWPNWAYRSYYRTLDFGAYLSYTGYGNTTNGRLVVMAARRDKNSWHYDRRDQWYESGSREYVYLQQTSTYKVLTFSNDGGGWWEEGAYYSIYFVKSGDKLTVYCKKYIDENDAGEWRELTGRTNMTNGVNAFNIFGGDFHTRSVTGFGFGMMPRLAANAMRVSGDGRTISNFGEDRLRRDDAPSASEYIREHSASHVHFAARVWKYAKSEYHLKDYGEDRFACDLEGGELHNSIVIDFAPILSDDEFATGIIKARINQGDASGGDNFSVYVGSAAKTVRAWEMGAEKPNTTLCPREIALLCIGDKGNNITDVAGKVFLSDLGDGSLVVQVGHKGEDGDHDGGRWMIAEKIWAEGTEFQEYSVSRATHTFINAWDKFNWISTLVYFDESDGGGGSRSLLFDSLCINGNRIFAGNLGGMDSSKQRVSDFGNGYIWLGNDAANTNNTGEEDLDETVHTGEFRMWKSGQGPDPTEGRSFNYLLGRVSENEFGNLQHYYKFQPDDYEVDTGGNAWDATIFDYATSPVPLKLYDSALLNRDGDDAATGVPFPTSAHETVANIEIFRSSSVVINDFENVEEVQKALDAARSMPQYYLATIPIGTTQYVDSSPSSAVGEQADFGSGYMPKGIVAAFVWDSRLVIIDDSNNMWPCEPGPVGWESFPIAIKVPNTKGPITAVINVQGERNQALVLVTGTSSATLLSGSPDAPVSHVLGEGVGAYSQRCVSHYSGIAFAFNGILWAIDQGRAVDFGGPVQELLPTPANARVATSAKLSSLFIIDTSDGTCLRYHFPTQQWTVEERYASAVGDLEDGTDAWISQYGSWSKGNTAVYGDDVQDDTRASITATLTKASDRVVTTSDIATAELHVGMPLCIVDSAGVAFATRIEVLSGATITTEDLAASGLTDGASGSATVYFGAGATGLLIDTGPMDVGDNSAISSQVFIDNFEGTGWEYGVFASKHPGDRDAIPALLTYTTMSTASGARASGVRGRFQRVVLRNRKREAARIPILEIEVK